MKKYNFLLNNKFYNSPIYFLGEYNGNNFYIKRDDLIPFSFGGNKARKGKYFLEDILKKESNCLITYGSSSSNHCRIIANIAKILNIPCYIISPDSNEDTQNTKLMEFLDAYIINCDITEVAITIDQTISSLEKCGFKTYFVPGGGHGNIGTKAYIDCYNEILDQEKQLNCQFDCIFHASGTGSTQAGLVCAELLNGDNKDIIGISIAREKERGRKVVVDCIQDYLKYVGKDIFDDKKVIFDDNYISGGYAKYNDNIVSLVRKMYVNYGIPMDYTYTGKAFYGMLNYLNDNNVKSKNILFIHTGGTPLFFGDLNKNDDDIKTIFLVNNTLNKKKLYKFLVNNDNSFPIPLSQKVNLDNYSSKVIKNGVVIGYEKNNELFAVVSLYCNNEVDKVAYISVICVDSKYKGKHFGTSLLNEAIKIVKQKKYKKLQLCTNKDNIDAISFYNKNGFKKIEEIKINEHTDIKLELEIGSD